MIKRSYELRDTDMTVLQPLLAWVALNMPSQGDIHKSEMA